MIKKLVLTAAVAGFLALTGCTVDCEVCCYSTEISGIKSCATAENVYESDCTACPEANSTPGVTCTCTSK